LVLQIKKNSNSQGLSEIFVQNTLIFHIRKSLSSFFTPKPKFNVIFLVTQHFKLNFNILITNSCIYVQQQPFIYCCFVLFLSFFSGNQLIFRLAPQNSCLSHSHTLSLIFRVRSRFFREFHTPIHSGFQDDGIRFSSLILVKWRVFFRLD
jgi:hypothetical protein